MKRLIVSFLLIGAVTTAFSQQQFTSSLYDLQGVFHNPSMSGVEKHGMVGITYRSMWSGIDGGPQTATAFGSTYLPNISSGIGANIYSDVTGPTKRIGLTGSYAYHIQLKNESSFSLGIEARVLQYSYDRAKLESSLGSNDPVLGTADNKIKGDAGFGVNYTSKKFQIGASVSQLVQSKLDFYTGNLTRSEEGKLYRHYYFHGKYEWQVDENTKIIPNFLFIYLPNAPLEFQGGARVEHNELFWWGVGLRANQSWMLSAGLHIKKKFTIGYSFDIYTTPLSLYDRGSSAHEIGLRYDFIK